MGAMRLEPDAVERTLWASEHDEQTFTLEHQLEPTNSCLPLQSRQHEIPP